MVKKVCVIGAGPAGLVAAKTLIHEHPGAFEVTVFEQSERIGGLWPISRHDAGLVNPEMRTNQSRHTVSFSDLAWPASSPIFPKAWQVGNYLQRYIKTYAGYEIRTSMKVVKAVQQSEAWEVHVQDAKSPSIAEVLVYDHVIVASGFFGKAKEIPRNLTASKRIFHSSSYRDLPGLLAQVEDSASNTPRSNIVVVGGQMSGVEVAASLAYQLSSEANAPGQEKPSQHMITHVIQRPFWVMPWFFPTNPTIDEAGSNNVTITKNNPAPTFLPLDLVAYNLQIRPPGQLENTSGHISQEAAIKNNGFMKAILGGDQSHLGVKELVITPAVESEPPLLGISDNYLEFARSGDIKIIEGKVFRQLDDKDDTIIVEHNGQEEVIGNVAAVIFATGFDAVPSLDFLPEELLKTLDLDPTGDVLPLALNVHAVVSHKFPSLGFVGFYRSPYWGVMEMQAKYLGKLWSGDAKAEKALAEDKTMDYMLALRRDPRRAQFPMGDYAYLMESFSEILDIKRHEPEDPAARTGQVFPPRYTYEKVTETSQREIDLARTLFYDTFPDSAAGKFVAKAVSRSLQGNWKLEREITSHSASYPSGTLSGTAKFLPRKPTGDDDSFDLEYLYLEEGDFKTDNGLNFTAKRSYVYRYSEPTDKLTAWFVKEDKSVDYFFHELIFSKGSEGWKATSGHWCSPDQYDVEYNFKFKGVVLTEWSQTYRVKGPNKDYTLQSRFTR